MQATKRAAIGSALASHGMRVVPAREHQRQSEDHDAAGPDVGAEVQRVGLQSLAVVLVGDALQSPRTPEVHDHRDAHNDESPDGGLDLDGMKEEALAGFVDDPDAGQQQQAGFEEGGEALDFAVAVLMIGVGGLVGDANRKIGKRRGDQVESRVRGFGEDAQAAGGRTRPPLSSR